MYVYRALFAVLAALIFGAAMSLSAADRGSVHPGGVDCGVCHLAGERVEPSRANRLVASQESLCIVCHKRATELSHPSGFVPRRTLPAQYPLDWKGELTCSTCHLTHGREAGRLRGRRHAREFCLSCHDRGFFSGMKDAGSSLVISGHLDIARARTTLDIDRHSLHCLGCHADNHAGGGTVSVSRAGVMRHSSGSAPHPIGVRYSDASSKGGLRPEFELTQRKILLSDGRVSCISCHEAYKKEPGKLVLPLARSALCLACHAK